MRYGTFYVEFAVMITELPLYTIGHSTHPIETFLEMLISFDIKVLADVRSMPGSRKFPQYDQETLAATLAEHDIQYIYFDKLGGRRRQKDAPTDTLWRNKSFAAYAGYMRTGEFKEGADELAATAQKNATAMMCSEAVWWRCHRSMVADYFKAKKWDVQHIMGIDKATEHPYTSPARIVGGEVYYTEK